MEERELFSFTWEGCTEFSLYSSREIAFLYSGFVSVYDMKGGVTRFMPRGTRNTYVSLAYSKDEHHLAAGSIGGRIVIWDTLIDDEIELCPLVGYLNRITSLSFLFDGSHIVSSSFDQTIRVWGVKHLSEYENDTNTYLTGLSSLT